MIGREHESSARGATAEPVIDELTVADEPDSWRRLGFAVEDGVCRAGSVQIRLAGVAAGRGLVSWAVSDLMATDLDGLRTLRAPRPSAERLAARPSHPNGTVSIDHVVAFSPDLERTVDALLGAGLSLRRVREGPTPGGAEHQAFFRLAEVILEVIEQPGGAGARLERDDPARLWGIALRVESFDACIRELGEALGEPRDAVQAGRRIAPVRRSAGLSVPLAFITPPPPDG